MAIILVTGSKGQLGSELMELSQYFSKHQFFFTDVGELDILDKKMLKDFISGFQPDYVVNCAAFTAVDKAEMEYEMALKVNFEAVRNLAQVCKANNTKLIHISTDYVFDGKQSTPYIETDKVNPVSAYGKSKLKGEKTILSTKELNAIIIRTSWLYSSYGNNFVKTISKYAREREQLNIVFDQIGCPTFAGDLASAIMEIIEYSEEKAFEKGIYHFSNEGVCSWYDFTKEIVKMSKIDCQINPIRTSRYPTPASRPAYSVFDKSKIKSTFKIEVPFWKDSLKKCLTILSQE